MAKITMSSVSRIFWLPVLAFTVNCGASEGTAPEPDVGSDPDVGWEADGAAADDAGGPTRGNPDSELPPHDGASADEATGDGMGDVPSTCMMDCPDDPTCLTTGECLAPCPPGQERCDGTCTDPATDSKHCSGCEVSCPSNQFCSQSVCLPACAQGETKCGQSCVNLGNNHGNCGGCGNACKPTEACLAQVCQCPAPNLVCNGACTVVVNNRNNCGACGRRCSGTQICSNNDCVCPANRPKACGGGICVADNECCGDQVRCATMCCPSGQQCIINLCVQF